MRIGSEYRRLKEYWMAMEDEKDSRSYEYRTPALAKLEERAVRMLWSLVEGDASGWWFWIRVAVAMLVITGGPAILIHLFLLGSDGGLAD
jgi:hypothetical protein